MRKYTLLFIVALSLLFPSGARAQWNKIYINYVGRVFLYEKKYEDAIEMFNKLIYIEPDGAEAYFNRGVAKYNLNDFFGAESDFSQAIDKNPVYTSAYLNRAITRLLKGDYAQALDDFQVALDLRPDFSYIYFNRAIAYQHNKQYDKAVEDFSTFIKYNNMRSAEAHINRGNNYLFLGDTVRALEDYGAALKINNEYPKAYYSRALIHMDRGEYAPALDDLNKSLEYDSLFIASYFARGALYADNKKPVEAISDFSKVLEIDPTFSRGYFNRAILRTGIGDYNNAMDDYDKVELYTPGNVLLYYNRANLHTLLGDYAKAITDYSKAIELYPDFANAYISRSGLRYFMNDIQGAKQDRQIAEAKIAEYRSKVADSTFSIYADTSRKFNMLMSFESRKNSFGALYDANVTDDNIAMMPMYKFTFRYSDAVPRPARYYFEPAEKFVREFGYPYFCITDRDTNMAADSLIMLENKFAAEGGAPKAAQTLFMRGVARRLIKQYAGALNTLSQAIELEPSNPFYYMARSVTRSEMTEFVSSIDNSLNNMTMDGVTVGGFTGTPSSRVYNYDESIADLNKAARLAPDYAYIYYNRGILHAMSGRMTEAYDDYTRAIGLYPDFAAAYYNRGVVQIYMKDTRKGLLDMSKAGELGIKEAYSVLGRFSYSD